MAAAFVFQWFNQVVPRCFSALRFTMGNHCCAQEDVLAGLLGSSMATQCPPGLPLATHRGLGATRLALEATRNFTASSAGTTQALTPDERDTAALRLKKRLQCPITRVGALVSCKRTTWLKISFATAVTCCMSQSRS